MVQSHKFCKTSIEPHYLTTKVATHTKEFKAIVLNRQILQGDRSTSNLRFDLNSVERNLMFRNKHKKCASTICFEAMLRVKFSIKLISWQVIPVIIWRVQFKPHLKNC